MFKDIDVKYTTKNVTRLFFLGLWDSIKVFYPIHLLYRSTRVRKVFLESLFFNLVLLGMNIYFEYFAPHQAGYWFWMMTWCLPMWLIATIYNYRWNKRLMELICKKKYSNVNLSTNAKREIAELFYGGLLIIVFQSQLSLNYILHPILKNIWGILAKFY